LTNLKIIYYLHKKLRHLAFIYQPNFKLTQNFMHNTSEIIFSNNFNQINLSDSLDVLKKPIYLFFLNKNSFWSLSPCIIFFLFIYEKKVAFFVSMLAFMFTLALFFVLSIKKYFCTKDK
jgi:hypothetical protein